MRFWTVCCCGLDLRSGRGRVFLCVFGGGRGGGRGTKREGEFFFSPEKWRGRRSDEDEWIEWIRKVRGQGVFLRGFCPSVFFLLDSRSLPHL